MLFVPLFSPLSVHARLPRGSCICPYFCAVKRGDISRSAGYDRQTDVQQLSIQLMGMLFMSLDQHTAVTCSTNDL
jgi:hypothetical protein